MLNLFRSHPIETILSLIFFILLIILGSISEQFLTLGNIFNLLNISAVNIIFAVGLLVVLIAGGIDISFAVAASVVQYVTTLILLSLGGGNWFLAFFIASVIGASLGLINAFFIHKFRIISIIVTIATFNIYFGLLMFFTKGVSLYNLPDWLSSRIIIFETQMSNGSWAEITFPVVVMLVCVLSSWFLINKTKIGRQIYAFGDNPEAARRFGIPIGFIQTLAFGWLGMMAGIAGLMQLHYAQEVVPNALFGRELDVLAAVVLGGCRLGGGKGTVYGAILGVLLIVVIQNGLNLLGISPFAFKMIIGLIIMLAITFSNLNIKKQAREG